jgi:hypothetical protein
MVASGALGENGDDDQIGQAGLGLKVAEEAENFV